MSTSPFKDPSKGDVVAGRYQLGSVLGRGAVGVVFEAKQLPLGRDVALKMMLADATQTHGSVERFVREAALAKKLTHPNTIQLVDFGQTDDGLPFIVWELLRGRTLAAEIAAAPLSVERVGRVADQVLKSLSEAHALGIVHRDIKPENVYLMDHAGERDFVKVLDFGVARPMTAVGDPTRKLTLFGQMIGTPSYMAPELVKAEEPRPATDLYALGLVMAEAICGECIIQGDTEIRIWTWQASDEPVVLPDVVKSSALGGVIGRATQKDMKERYGSCDEMRADLSRALAKLALAPPPPSVSSKPRVRQRTARLEGAPPRPSASSSPMIASMPPLMPSSPPPRPSPSAMPPPPSVAPPAYYPAQTTPAPRSRSVMVLVIVAVLVVVAAAAGAVLLRRRPPPRHPERTTSVDPASVQVVSG